MSDPDHLQMWEDYVADMDKNQSPAIGAGDVAGLINAIRSYQQADEDGVMVLVSRQACNEVAAALASLTAEKRTLANAGINLLERAEQAEAALVAAEGEKRRLMLNHNDMVRRKRDAEAIKDARAEAAEAERDAALAEVKRMRDVLGWFWTWINNPASAYSTASLDGLFGMARDRIAALAPTQEKPECR